MLKRVWSFALVVMITFGVCVFPDIQVSAKTKVSQFAGWDAHDDMVSAGNYLIVNKRKNYKYADADLCIYKKSNPKTPIKKIRKIYSQNIAIVNKKVYWMKKQTLYCYNLATKKTSAVCELDMEYFLDVTPDYRHSTFLAANENYLYYNIYTDINWSNLYRIDTKTGKWFEIKKSIDSLGVYNGYLYCFDAVLDAPSSVDIYRLKLGTKKLKKIVKKAAVLNIKIYNKKIYYMSYANRNMPNYDKITTTLYSCNMNGSNKKKIKKWNKKTMSLLQCRKNAIYTTPFAYSDSSIYKCNLKTKKTGKVNNLTNITGIKTKQYQYGNKNVCKISWSDNNTCSVHVSYATKKDFSDKKNIYTGSNYCTLKNLTAGKTYYIKVRAYSGDEKKCSSYSKVYKVKIKK